MAKKEDLITKYSGIAARHTVAALDRNATPEQATQASNNVRAAERQLERLRTGHIE